MHIIIINGSCIAYKIYKISTYKELPSIEVPENLRIWGAVDNALEPCLSSFHHFQVGGAFHEQWTLAFLGQILMDFQFGATRGLTEVVLQFADNVS